MAPVVSDQVVWEDLSARIAAHEEIAPVPNADLPAMFDAVAEHHGIEAERVRSVYLARSFMVGAG